eukprot:CAMPEP_0197028814 /NCGR_PEP_ID=MMETSP1384-20130603/8415_1 /TAXON_ID=29189 /ORGANISM="Ammonia sp." /LENGTH=180 /DNA_ID=CAMNT_0042457873 /DNA_START=26 /DNA_END=568 /DNA_ORIENTATION=+
MAAEAPPANDDANKAADAEQADEKKEENESAAADASTVGVNFTGAWELTTNENLDEFMKSQGIGYMKRKLMSMASITLNIDHKGESLKVNAKLPIGEINEELTFDGKEKTTKNPMGEEVRMKAEWSDGSKTKLIIKTHNIKNDKKVTMERTMPDANTLQDVMTNDQNITMTRTFKRKAIK